MKTILLLSVYSRALWAQSMGVAPPAEIFTAGTGGTTANTLCQTDTSNPAKAIATTTGVYGVCLDTVSAAAVVRVARYGQALCVTDTGGSTSGDLALIGTGSTIDCKDAGAATRSSLPMSTRIVGVFRSSATAGNPALVELEPYSYGTASGHAVAFSIDGGGSAITTGALKDFVTAAFSGTIYRIDIAADQAGSVTVDVWKAAGAIPTSGNKISASAPLTLSSAQLAQNGSLSGWTTAVAVGDVFGFSVATATTVTHVDGQIWYQ